MAASFRKRKPRSGKIDEVRMAGFGRIADVVVATEKATLANGESGPQSGHLDVGDPWQWQPESSPL